MAESYAEATSGSGLKWHSWTRSISGSTVHAGFTLPDEYPYASYVALYQTISIGTANDHIAQLMAGSSLNVRIRRIRIEQSNSAGTSTAATFQILRLTTAGTGGTAITPATLDTADSASGATAMSLPTAKGTESTVLDRQAIPMRQTVSTLGGTEDSYEWIQLPNMKPIIIAAGTSNGIAIKSLTAIATATVNIHIGFVETAFV